MRLFLAIAGEVIDVPACIISFQLCGERVDFYFLLPIPSSIPANHPPPMAHVHHVPPVAISEVEVFDGDGDPV